MQVLWVFTCVYGKFLLPLRVFLQSKRKMIKHDGIIIALNGDGTARVRIVQTSACAACKAKAMCASAESAEKEMTVQLTVDSLQLTVGDAVEVMVQQKMGWKAVVLAYLLPFFVMLAVMFIGNGLLAMGDGLLAIGDGQLAMGDGAKREAVLGTVALCAMAVYYLVLGMFKDKLQKEFSFTARKKD